MGHAIGDQGGGDAFALGTLENFRQSSADAFDMRLELGGAASATFVAGVDDAAGVDGVVRGIQTSTTLLFIRQVGAGQLVVGGAADDPAFQAVKGVFIDGAAQRAG